MNRLRITGGRLIDPDSGLDTVGDLCLADGVIAAVGHTPDGFTADRTLDATGRIVCPGLIDLSARLGEPGAEHKATIASEARAAAAAGITTLACAPDTSPAIDSPSVVELIHRRATDAAAARVLPVGALTLGLDGEHLAELAALSEAGCPAVSDGGRAIASTTVLRRALDYAATFELPVLLTPADPWLADGCVHEGPVATRLGLPGVPSAAESAGLGRTLATASIVGAPVHVGRLSALAALPALRQARAEGGTVSADVAIHQLFFTEQDTAEFDSRFHVRPPLRSTTDREGLRRAVAAGEIQVICSDHTPQDADAKDGPFTGTEPGMSGLDTLLPMVLRLVEDGVLGLADALARVTVAPARVLGLPTGRLADGAPADVCVFDPDAVWWCTGDTLNSRGHNSPFLGWEMTGRATATVVGGRLVHGGDDRR